MANLNGEHMNELLTKAIMKDNAAANELLKSISFNLSMIAKTADAMEALLIALQSMYEFNCKQEKEDAAEK